MSQDINTWKLSIDGVILAQILQFDYGVEAHSVINKSLNGFIYFQTVGTGTKYANINVYSTKNQKDTLEELMAIGEEIRITYKDRFYIGIMEDGISWTSEEPGKTYIGSGKFLIQEVFLE